MKSSVFLRKIIQLLLAAILLSGLLTACIYFLVMQQMYVSMRAEELAPIARTIAELLTGTEQNGPYNQNVMPLFDPGNKDFLGATLHIYDTSGQTLMDTPENARSTRPPKPDEGPTEAEVASAISNDLQTVLSGEEVSAVRKTPDGKSYLVVGVPIQNDGSVVGAVVFTKAMSELNEASSGLYLALLISTLISFLIMLVPGYLAAKRLTVPVRQMRDVARAMAKGDFSVRADESQKGEIGELGRSMNFFAVESARLEQTRRDFVANVSHELRTPIAAIRAIGETLRDGMAKTEDRKMLFYNNIVRESLRLSRLVDDLLELSRLQSGTEAMQKTKFDLCEVFRNISESFSHTAETAGVNFSAATATKPPVYVYSNPDRVEQVLVNIMDNAVKHTPKGGTVALSAENRGGKVNVCVSNSGEGIDPDDLPHIFERFYKADKSHSGGGTGLGLSIAGEIIKGLGESITAQSADGLTRFEFTLSLPGPLK
jgi:signal transduction histidine kinase